MEDKNLNKENFNDVARAAGAKLGFLIASSLFPYEVKDQLAAIAEKMSAKQLDELTEVFEARYLNEKTEDIDEEFKKKIAEVLEKYRQEDEKK